MSFLLELPFDTTDWPVWLQASAPQLWRAGIILGAVILAWAISFFCKVLLRAIGRRVTKKSGPDFEGTVWDIAAPVAQFAIFAGVMTVALELLGLSVGAQLRNAWPAVTAVVLIFIAAYFIARWIRRTINSFGERAHRGTHADKTLFGFFASILSYAVFVIAAVLALGRLGFDTNTLVALVGAAGLAIGLALQDTLKAAASGVMLAVFRPFRIGDWTQIGANEGEVIQITPFQTSLRGVDNRVIIVPNTLAWSDQVTNYSRQPRRRLDLYFDISYDDDIDKALGVVRETANAHPRVLAKDETWVGVHTFAASSIVIRLRAFVPGPEFVQVRADMYRAMKYAFDKAGITIPYPHQVEIHRDTGRDDREDGSEPRGSDRHSDETESKGG